MPHDLAGCRRSLIRAEDFTLPGAESHYPPDLGIEPVHLDIALTLNIPARAAKGSVLTRVTANRAGARRLVLHACDFEELTVADEDGRALSHRYDGREIELLWEEPFEHGEERRVRVRYVVKEPVSGLHFSVPDEDYPHRAMWAATDHETERARHWLPCVDLPAVRTTLDFHLTASEELTILANGVPVSESPNGNGTKTAHWTLDFPCPSYLVCFVAGDLVRADDQPVGERALAYFCARGRGTEEDLLRSFGKTPSMIEWMQERLRTDFPFPKYFQFALPQFGGAMENISLVSWDDVFVADETMHREFGRLIDIVNVHEMAHSYFGDAVVIRDFAHAWLKESWATYMEVVWLEDVLGEDEGRYELFRCARDYMREADESYVRPIVTRVFSSSWDMYDLHLYPGGACRLHMLRRRLGEEVFWAAVADYLRTFTRKTVETEDFRRKLEEHSGRSLGKFFDQWIHGRGYPKLKVVFNHDKEKGEGTFTLTQEQVAEGEADRKPDGPQLFAFPLTIAWESAEGEWTRREVEVEGRRHAVSFPMPEAPLQVRIDPEDSLLHRLEMNPGDDMLRRAVRHAPDMTGRILAAEELAKTGKRKNVLAVGSAMAEEPFWGARLSMAEAVAKSKTATAIDVLTAHLEREENPRVQRVLAAKLGEFRDGRVAAALTAFLDGAPTYLAAASALVALGKQRGADHLPRLLEAAADDGHRGIVRAGGLQGLAETREVSAFEHLRGRVGYGREPDDSSRNLPFALASIARHLPRRYREQAVEDLGVLARDGRARVRMAVARALGRLGEGAGVPILEGLLTTVPEQDATRVRRQILRIRKEGSGESASGALTKRIEELEEKNRKLEARLDDLEARADAGDGEATSARS